MTGQHVVAQDAGRVPGDRDPPVVQQQQPVGELPGQREVVHHRQHRQRALPAQLVHQFQGRHPAAQVQGAGRLVEQQHRSVLGQGPGQHGPLQLAAGQGAEPAAGHRAQFHPVQQPGADIPVGLRLGAQVADVRGPAQQHVVHGGHVRGQFGQLGDVCDEPGQCTPAHPGGRLPADRDRPLMPHESRGGTQESRLAGSVAADDAQPLAGRDLLADLSQRLRAAVPDADPLEGDHASSCRALLEWRMKRKKGAPARAVITPIGTSSGDCTVRARTSARTRNAAPPIIDTGSTIR